MLLTEEEKTSIIQMKHTDYKLTFDDETRGVYQFEIEKVSSKEYRVSKLAIMCLDVKYFSKPEEVIGYIQSQREFV